MPFNKPPSSVAFFDAFEDATIFDCGDINLLKVAQDAVVRSLGKNIHRTYFNQSFSVIYIWLFFKRLRRKARVLTLPNTASPKILVMIPPRFVYGTEGKNELQYLGKILNKIPRDKMHLLYTHYSPDCPIEADGVVQKIIESYEHHALENWEKKFLNELNQCFKRIQSQARFSVEQINDIRVGFDEFWRKYRAIKKYLSAFEFSKSIVIPGYQTEHVIAALRSFNTEVIEIQHGVITTSSPFYCYPKKVKPVALRALFADKIWLFGKFWKKELLKGSEYDETQMEILGDYFVRNVHPPKDVSILNAFEQKFEKRILIGTQTKRHEAFNQMIKHLSAKYLQQKPKVGILVKRHPAETPELYASLSLLPNVLIVEASLDFLYPRCAAYVSMYSNTLFEAVRFYPLQLFVLESPETVDLVNGIVSTGVAKRIQLEDDPIESEAAQEKLHPDDFFDSEMNITLIEELGKVIEKDGKN